MARTSSSWAAGMARYRARLEVAELRHPGRRADGAATAMLCSAACSSPISGFYSLPERTRPMPHISETASGRRCHRSHPVQRTRRKLIPPAWIRWSISTNGFPPRVEAAFAEQEGRLRGGRRRQQTEEVSSIMPGWPREAGPGGSISYTVTGVCGDSRHPHRYRLCAEAGYRQNAHWVMNHRAQAAIRKLKDGGSNYVAAAGRPSSQTPC